VTADSVRGQGGQALKYGQAAKKTKSILKSRLVISQQVRSLGADIDMDAAAYAEKCGKIGDGEGGREY